MKNKTIKSFFTKIFFLQCIILHQIKVDFWFQLTSWLLRFIIRILDLSFDYLHLPDLIRLLHVGLYLLQCPHRTSVNVLCSSGPEGSRKEAKNSAAYLSVCGSNRPFHRLSSDLWECRIYPQNKTGRTKSRSLSLYFIVCLYSVCLCFVGTVILKWTTCWVTLMSWAQVLLWYCFWSDAAGSALYCCCLFLKDIFPSNTDLGLTMVSVDTNICNIWRVGYFYFA